MTNPFASIKDYPQECAKPGWDGYFAQPVLQTTVDFALKLFELLPQELGWEPGPGVDGSVTLEWRPNLPAVRKLFLDVYSDTSWIAYWIDKAGNFDKMPGTGIEPDTKQRLDQLFARLRT